MKKTLFTLLFILLLSSIAYGAKYTQKQIQFVDEWGDPVNMGTSVSLYVYDVNSTTEKTVYLDKAGDSNAVQPITDDSTNTPLNYTSGLLTFWSMQASYKMTVTDGTYTRTLDNITTSDTRMMWPSFLVALSSYSLGQSEDLDFTHGAWVMDGDTAGRLDLIPDVADGIFAIGDSSGSQQGDVYTYASSTEFMYFDQSGAELNLTHIDVIVDDDSTLYFGDGKDIAFKFDNGGDDLDITGSGSELAIGASGAGLDVYIHGQTGNFAYFDYTNDRTFFEDWDLRINEGSLIEFADTGDAVDWKIECATAERLAFIPTETTDDQTFHIGDATHTSDVVVFMDTVGETLTIDASEDSLTFVGDLALFTLTGSTVPFRVDCTTQVSSGNAIELETSDGPIQILADGGTYGTITIDAEHDLTLTTTAAAADIIIDSTLGSILIDSGENAASAISLITNTGTSETIVVTNTKGTDAASIDLQSTVGGITLTANAAGKDVGIYSVLGSIILKAEENAANAIYLHADAETTSTIKLYNETGTGDESILVSSELGGVTVEALAGSIDIEAGGGAGDLKLDAGNDMTVTVAGDLTYVVTGAMVLPDEILLRAVVDINEDEIDDLEGTPFEVVAAPTGATIEFVSAILAMDYGGTAWTEDSDPDDLCIRYADGSGAIVSMLIEATGFATATADTVVFVAPVSDIVGGTTAAVPITEANSYEKSLVLDNTGTDWTGNGNGAIRVIVYYRLHTVAELGL